MATTTKRTGRAGSIPGGMAISAAISMAITVFLSLMIAYSIQRESITWEQAGYWIMGMLFAASFLGSKAACWFIKRQKLAVSLMSGTLYWGMLLCLTALFFGGSYDCVLETAGIIIAGCATASLLELPAGKKRKKGRVYR